MLAFGVIRPYKGLGDAIEAVRRAGDARLIVAGDPLEPMEPYRRAAQGVDVDWRLGYLPQAEVDRALGEATIAVFPYKPELDQSGALLRALGAAFLRSPMTSAASPSPYAPSPRAPSCRRVTSKRSPLRCTRSSLTARLSNGPVRAHVAHASR